MKQQTDLKLKVSDNVMLLINQLTSIKKDTNQIEIVKEEIVNILSNGVNIRSFLELSDIVNYLTINYSADEILRELEAVVKEYSKHISITISSSINKIKNSQEKLSSLMEISNLWKDVVSKFTLIRQITSKLESALHSIQGSININIACKHKNLWTLFISHLNFDFEIKNIICSLILQLVKEARQVNIDHIRSNSIVTFDILNEIQFFINFIKDSHIYSETLEVMLQKQSIEFYESFSNTFFLNEPSLEYYFNIINSIFEIESDLFNKYLSATSLPIMKSTLELTLISNQIIVIIDLVTKTKNINIWKEVFNIVKKVKAENVLYDSISLYIKNNITFYLEKDNINDLICFICFIDDLCTKAFHDDETLKQQSKESIYSGINQKPNKVAEIFNNYIDKVILNKKNDSLDLKFEKFMMIFKHLEAKDYFIQCFATKLLSRLIYEPTTNIESERKLVEKIKIMCGIGFVSKIEEIISDFEISKSLTTSFLSKNYQYKSKKSSIEFRFIILSEIYMREKAINHSISPEIDFYLHQFTVLYNQMYSGRSFKWKLDSSHAYVSFNKRYLLSVSGLQVCILLYLDKERKAVDDKSIFKILKDYDKTNVTKALDALVKKNIIIKNNSSLSINIEFSSLKDFTNEAIVVHEYLSNPQITTEVSDSDIKQEEEKLLEDRKPVIDCLIMKSLKFNKQMTQGDLIISVKQASKFKCEDSIIILRIDHLLSNEFISKDSNGILKYFA